MALSMEQCTLLSLVKLLIVNSQELAIMLIHSHAYIHIVKYNSTLHMGRWLKRTVTVGCMWHEQCSRRQLYFDLFSTLDAFMGGKGFTIFSHDYIPVYKVTVEKCRKYINHQQKVIPKIIEVKGDAPKCPLF